MAEIGEPEWRREVVPHPGEVPAPQEPVKTPQPEKVP